MVKEVRNLLSSRQVRDLAEQASVVSRGDARLFLPLITLKAYTEAVECGQGAPPVETAPENSATARTRSYLFTTCSLLRERLESVHLANLRINQLYIFISIVYSSKSIRSFNLVTEEF